MVLPRPKYVRSRLTLWYVLVLGVSLIVSAAGASLLLFWQMRAQLERQAVQDLETVEGLLFFTADGKLHFNEEYHNHPESKLVQDRYLEVLSPDGAILYRNDRLAGRTMDGAPFNGEGVGGYSERSTRISDGTLVMLASRRHLLDGHPILIRLAYSQERIWSRLTEFWLIVLLALPVVLGLAAIAGYSMVNRALDPIQKMVQRAEEITTERLHERLTVESGDELGQLGRVFNQMLSRIEQSFEQLRRFTADASHELRTPLAAIRAVGEVSLQKDTTAEEYRDTIGSMLEEISRLTNLVENLLTLSRADGGQILMKLETFPLSEIMEQAARLLDVLVEEKHLTFHCETDPKAMIRGDRSILRLAAINILHNAVKFTPVAGIITARVSCEGSKILMSVTDSGPGIPVEHTTKVFDRFYRVDQARADGKSGAGLGLPIAQWAAKAHDGEIGVSPAPGGGCTFWVRLPLASSLTGL